MQYQNNPMIQGNQDDKSQLLNPGQTFPLYPPQSNQNPPQVQYYQNPQQYQNYPSQQQVQNLNNNMLNYQQIGQNNQLYVAPGVQSNKLTIPFNNGVIYFLVYLLITGIVIVYNIYSDYQPFMIIFFSIELLLHFAFAKRSIEITKDEYQKKLNIKVTSYLCCNRENHDFDLENVIFNVILQCGTYTLFVINNYKKNNGMYLSMYEINNKTANIFLYYSNITVLKFNEKFNLITLLINFICL